MKDSGVEGLGFGRSTFFGGCLESGLQARVKDVLGAKYVRLGYLGPMVGLWLAG